MTRHRDSRGFAPRVVSRSRALANVVLLALVGARCGPRTVHIDELLERKAQHPVPLHQATARGEVGRMRRIIRRKPDAVNEPDRAKWTPLHFAAIWGEPEAARLLLESGADVDPQNGDGNTPLFLAACYGEEALVRLLLDRGARVDAKGRRGLTALHLAVCNDWSGAVSSSATKYVAFKAEHGDNYFLDTSPDCPPSMTLGGFKEIVDMLLDHGADVNARDGYNTTPLMRAVDGGYSEIVKILIARKADVHAENTSGSTALHDATGMTGDPKFFIKFGWEGRASGEVVKLLLAAGANPNARDKNGRTPLHGAAAWGRIDLARALLDAGADINAKDNAGTTPLDTATRSKHPGSPGLVKFLREWEGRDQGRDRRPTSGEKPPRM